MPQRSEGRPLFFLVFFHDCCRLRLLDVDSLSDLDFFFPSGGRARALRENRHTPLPLRHSELFSSSSSHWVDLNSESSIFLFPFAEKRTPFFPRDELLGDEFIRAHFFVPFFLRLQARRALFKAVPSFCPPVDGRKRFPLPLFFKWSRKSFGRELSRPTLSPCHASPSF